MRLDDFVVARNPDADSTLPYLIRVPLGPGGVVLKARDRWPRTAKVYCHAAPEWPADAEVLERVPVRSCVRRGAAIDLILDRARENRSQIVFTRVRGGREAIFWQTARTAKQARPNVALPTKQSVAGPLTIIVDAHEQHPWRFARQNATTVRRALPAGDYGIELDGALLASVERKSLPDLVSTLTSGRLRYVMADLAALPRAAVVVEDRYSSVFRLDHVRPAVVADGLAEAQVRFPNVPIVFAETRPLAEEWSYRFLGAALAELASDAPASALAAALPTAGPLSRRPASTAEIRSWALGAGLAVSDRGRPCRERPGPPSPGDTRRLRRSARHQAAVTTRTARRAPHVRDRWGVFPLSVTSPEEFRRTNLGKAGDLHVMIGKEPFEVLVTRHGPTVLRVCRAVVGPVDADDAWSETFLAAMRAYPALPHDANIEAWLVTIAHRKAIDASRATARRPLPVDGLPDMATTDENAIDIDPDLVEALAELPSKQRHAVAYHHVAGLPYAEVAAIVGGTTDAARRAAADGMATLRRTYPGVAARKGTRP